MSKPQSQSNSVKKPPEWLAKMGEVNFLHPLPENLDLSQNDIVPTTHIEINMFLLTNEQIKALPVGTVIYDQFTKPNVWIPSKWSLFLLSFRKKPLGFAFRWPSEVRIATGQFATWRCSGCELVNRVIVQGRTEHEDVKNFKLGDVLSFLTGRMIMPPTGTGFGLDHLELLVKFITHNRIDNVFDLKAARRGPVTDWILEQFPEFRDLDVSTVKDASTADQWLAQMQVRFGSQIRLARYPNKDIEMRYQLLNETRKNVFGAAYQRIFGGDFGSHNPADRTDLKTPWHETLGVSSSASRAEIKSAFRSLAKKFHPDHHPNDEQALEKMKEINGAYRAALL